MQPLKKFIAIIILFISSSALIQCSTSTKITIHYSPAHYELSNSFLAGASKADITPPPGKPLAGYSSNANFAKGFRTRLYARVIYLKSPLHNAIALVQCDLLSGSSLVQQRVAELVASTTDVAYNGIVIAGNHTHSGPGNYFESNFYNRFASNASGFDEDYFNFLCNQIAQAIIEAYNNRKPGMIAYGEKTLYGFTRNRSITAYTANANANSSNPLKAVNPILSMIRIDTVENRSIHPIAALSIFSIHGTAVPDSNDLYSADVFAYIERELELEMQRNGATTFIHAVVNGTHADNAPNIMKGKQGFQEARRIGIQIGHHAIELFNELSAKLSSHVDSKSVIQFIDVYAHPTVDGATLCIPPKVGNTLLAGASDGGPTPIISSTPFFMEGSRRFIFTCGCQKNKRIAAGPLQPLILPGDDFPHILTFQSIAINQLLLLPVPFEVTCESGKRIANAALTASPHTGIVTPIVISCANGYTGYCTTPEEYAKQRYEGGHTLYGPSTQPYLAKQYAQLSVTIAQNSMSDSSWTNCYVLKLASFYKKYPMPTTIRREALSKPVYVCNPGIDETYVEFTWSDLPPDYMEFHQSLVSIEYSTDGIQFHPFIKNGITVDDTGYDIAVLFTGTITKEGNALYTTRWYNPELAENVYFRFAIQPRQKLPFVYSEPFSW
ncbi:MAG TPA: neutral/alkaline non-lysosomal ceramidase N-terminal domain-containing protein [Spirochaetota bacterium]|nr:neutral/alkaline non-lysosomal ceramidase N-terminal domain-containing protein [Spirochaetota bacterium]HOT18978.1 neutral/alkaline non-lysosomal ceramidase N-terminal domain-containing protein [Spirochaetota bacterium]HPD05687.1 neutral/alkaline non-lysosomal ceramidase N-terminal domain-containing protein [Spirochaetota bacterium]HPK43936.1 neutral/alkaline non-lysosomal ceramidase N-terminal domain-containing protein [Spirochaetota bacterium]HQG43102.1 neutral/alkaline non-lysosomal ceram